VDFSVLAFVLLTAASCSFVNPDVYIIRANSVANGDGITLSFDVHNNTSCTYLASDFGFGYVLRREKNDFLEFVPNNSFDREGFHESNEIPPKFTKPIRAKGDSVLEYFIPFKSEYTSIAPGNVSEVYTESYSGIKHISVTLILTKARFPYKNVNEFRKSLGSMESFLVRYSGELLNSQ
jgi:hypothetical protein